MDGGCSRSRAEARRLEDKVATVAAKKCSVEEVSSLHKELQEWLTSEVKEDDQVSIIKLDLPMNVTDLRYIDVFIVSQRRSTACNPHEPFGPFRGEQTC